MFKFFRLMLILIASTALSFSQGNILVQVIHNCPDPAAGNIIVRVGAKLITSSSGIGYKHATPFFPVKSVTEIVSLNGSKTSFSTNLDANHPVVVLVLQGVTAPDEFDNPYGNDIESDVKIVYGIKTEGIAGMISSSLMQGTTDAPALTFKEKSKDVLWGENIQFNNMKFIDAVSFENEPRLYEMDILNASDNSNLVSFNADLSTYANKAMFIFTSGFLNPAKNKNGSKLGVFAALSDGTVIEFPLSSVIGTFKPGKPLLISPEKNSLIPNAGNYAEWKKQSDANTYNLQISESNTFGSNFVDEKNLTENKYLYKELKGATKYYWRVQAVNEAGESEWSDIWLFTTKKDNSKPEKPVLLSPENNAVGQNLTGLLKWNASEKAEKYDIELAKDVDFIDVVLDSNDMTTIQYQYYSLENNKKYFWHIKSKNISGDNGWSETWSFTTRTKFVIPSKPTLLSPANNSQNHPVTGLLSWNAVEDAQKYDVEIAIDADFMDVVQDTADLINPEFTYYDLANNSKYFWRTKAKSEAGSGAWSDTWTFTIMSGDGVQEDATSEEICIYPNPASNFIDLIINYNTNILTSKVSIVNIYGVEVQSQTIHQMYGSNRIDISNLVPGVYYIRTGDKTQKFVKM